MSMQDTTPSQEWAKFINRLTEWLLPDVTSGGKKDKEVVSRWHRYLPTAVGTFIWIYGVFVLQHRNEVKTDEIFIPFYFMSKAFPSIFITLIGLTSMVMIAESIKHGTALRFFLRSLFIPTVAFGIIKLAVL